LRRPPPEKKGPRFPPLLIPIGAGLIVVVLVAVALVLLSGGDDKAVGHHCEPDTGADREYAGDVVPAAANAIAVGFGVSVVPVRAGVCWRRRRRGKELVTYAPNGDPRAFLLGPAEGERDRAGVRARHRRGRDGERDRPAGQRPEPAVPEGRLGGVRRDQLHLHRQGQDRRGRAVQGYVEAYRRKDKVVTALDFRTRVDFAQKAEADAGTMKKSVLDSL
jgi:hypothetical protein